MSTRATGYAWHWLLACGLVIAGLVAIASGRSAAADNDHDRGGARALVGTWSASPQLAGGFPVPFATGLSNQTIRQIVHTSVGGHALRIRLTNAFGTAPVIFDAAYVGLQREGADLVPRSNRQVTFGGRNSVTIAAGAEVLSDPVNLRVSSQQNLAISLFTSGSTGTPTVHLAAVQTNYVSGAGNFAASDAGTPFANTSTAWYFMDGVDVIAHDRLEGSIVAFGDSITDGVGATVDANRRWPDRLADRLVEHGHSRDLGVLNQGISGNRVLNDSACFGVNAQARLDRDVLTQQGVRFVILLEGINDIGFSAINLDQLPPAFRPCVAPNPDVSAAQIIAGYQQIIARVHSKGISIIGGTLLPFKGAGYYTEAGEAKRNAVNAWIRTSGEFDGVIDFDRATRNPADPLTLLPAYDSGDHLHPSDAGYQAMADAIDLRLFRN